MTSRLLLSLLALVSAPVLTAQTTNLRVTVSVGGSIVTVGEGGSVPIQWDGRDITAFITLTNGGAAPITINQITLSGSDFALFAVPALPAALGQNGSLSYNVRYRPVSGRSSVGQTAISYTEAAQARSFNFSLAGSAPEYAFSIAGPTGTRVAVTPGSRITFSATRPGSSQTQTLIVLNRGAATGTINSIGVTGADYAAGLTGGLSVPVGQEVSIPITFSPKARGLSTGSITLDLGSGLASFGLDGTGAAPEYVVAYALRTDGNVRPLSNDGRLTFIPTPATTTALADVAIANQGNGPGSVRSVSLTGAGFQLTALPLLPATVEAGQVVRFAVQFNPRQLGSYSGSIRIELDDRTITAIVEGTTSSPDFGVSYIDPVSRNTVAVPDGTTLSLPSATVNTSPVYTVVLRNRGEGTGFVNSIAASGDAFQLIEIPALPASIAPAGELRFGLRFSPKQRDLQTGSIRVDFSNNVLVIPLSGLGIGPSLAYETTNSDGTTAPIPVGSELSFSSAVGQLNSKAIRVTNLGTSEAQIDAISVTGTGFQLANVPFLPVTIPVSGSQTFAVNFTPAQPGSVRGRLRVGDQNFELVGTGIAARLEFSYTNEAGTTPVTDTQPVVLTPARVGESSSVMFSVRNTGTSASAISIIDIVPSSPVFAIENIPALPLSLEAGSSIQFRLRFSPNNIGNATATLRINTTAINIVGAGRQPVPLPEQRIEGPMGVQPPLQQPAVGLSLATPYSLPLRGTLVLTFTSEVFSENPAVQFATGGRTVAFTIPANSTRAVFDNGVTEIRLQTGTVAGVIQLKPTFTTQAGLDLIPDSPAVGMITIARAAPRLLTVEIAGRTTNSLVLFVTGYSTTRTLRQVEVRLAPRGDQKFSSTTATLNIESTALVWFQSAQSQALGGLFSMTIPVTLQRGDSTENLIQYLQSVGITISNEVGASNAVDSPL